MKKKKEEEEAHTSMSSVTNPYLSLFPSTHRKKTGVMDDSGKPLQQQQQQQIISSSTSGGTKFKFILILLLTNLLSIYISISYSSSSTSAASAIDFSSLASRFSLWDSQSILRELNTTQAKLGHTETQLATIQRRLTTSNSLLETLLAELGEARRSSAASSPPEDGWQGELSGELKLAVGPHKLPLGFNPNIDSDEILLPLGAACRRHQDQLERYMAYKPGGECPSDDVFAQRLMLKGCEPLPRRRCHPKSPKGFVEPAPWPESLWSTPADTSVVWDPYTCKDYKCLVGRNKAKGSYDCKDCFDLGGREKVRWTGDFGELDYGIDTVLKLRKKGTIRIGLDIGGGSGTFAARMRERGNVTIVTSTMNFDGPFNSFIASRGLVPMHISIAHRLPFFDNTLDIVHSMHVLSNWVPDAVLEFALFDIYRVLRPGGIFWLDHFFCVGAQLNATYVPMFDGIGFRKLRWNAGRKLDRGVEMNEWYLSALLEKPMS